MGIQNSAPQQARHYINGATAASMKRAVKSVNQLYVDNFISYEQALSLRNQLLQFVVTSHKDVISNLFIV